jgi:dehydrogenase/reductase SDR family member 7B
MAATFTTFTNKTILITGASAGIGKALALQLSKAKNTLLLVGRNELALASLKKEIELNGSTALVFVCDLSIEENINQLIAAIKSAVKVIDVLINNAGVSQRSYAMQTNLKVDQYLFQLNYFSLVQLTRGVFSLLQLSQHPRIIIMSSMSGKFGFFQRSAYAASKHALHGFFESMQLELVSTPLRITMVCPGRIKTDISLNALTGDGQAHNQMDDGQLNGIEVEICANKIIQAAQKGKFQLIITNNEHWLWYIKKVSLGLFYKIASKIKQ